MVERLEAADFVGLINSAIEALKLHKEEINAMNVFPVPDGDTGTNMLLTMQAVREALGNSNHVDMAYVCQAMSRGSLMGARGNSGVVLSQILKGMTDIISNKESVDVDVMSEALSHGSDVAYRAVMKPVEGTILTVVREASEEGIRVREGYRQLEDWFNIIVEQARQTLEHTPDMLPVLKEAGVVDAGGRGLLAIFEGILAHLTGQDLGNIEGEIVYAGAGLAEIEAEDYRYEAQFILQGKDSKIEGLRETLNKIGGSVLVVGGDKTYRVHVHTDELGKVIEESSNIGRLSDVDITDLKLQAEDARSGREAAGRKLVGVVAVAVGDGIKEVLLSMGVNHIVEGGQSMNPSTAEILKAIRTLPQQNIIVIPNNKNIILAAEQTKELSDKKIALVPSGSITEGFAALVAFDPRADLETNRDRMTKAMKSVKTGAVTAAVRDSKYKGGKIKKGNYIGLFKGDIVSAAGTAKEAARKLLEKMMSPKDELVTVIIGEEADEADHGEILDFIGEKGLEPEVIEGGQPVYQYIFGIE
ncbi:MAG: hypothetical protein A2Y75_05975 [Candidatus Solincola sediminis]|uniref:DhaL domain-containing protein n=1 Tax=Candidatus Solincola sediminis TaxID=1797199 RepID=A0A1F2WFU8_9ACTN|nr:MAG: hypothetical protein A2Y75_05975 [Candidatus Solincola sediminis]